MGLLIAAKRVKSYKNSSGSKRCLFQQSNRSKTKICKNINFSNSEEALCNRLKSNKNCCSIGMHYMGCIGRKFLDQTATGEVTNTTKLMEYVKKCRVITKHKDKEEIRNFVKDLFERSSVCDDSGRIKFMNYRLPIFDDMKSYVSVENNKVCRRGISTAYGFSVKLLQNYSFMKKHGLLRKFLVSTPSFTDSTIHHLNYNQTKEAFENNLPDSSFLDSQMVQAALTPRPPSYQFCVIWLTEHFEIYGDKAPNKLEIHVSVTTKRSLYESYRSSMQTRQLEVVSYSVFVNIWNTLFPNVKQRPWVDVPGKCSTCYLIDRMRKTAEEREVQYHLGLAHNLHRGGFFMLERERYYKNIYYAVNHKETVMSIIIDGMDQNHCRVPYLGTQNKFGNSLNQGITGVKEHGVGLTIYRTAGTVKNKNSDFTMYCILSQLESWFIRNRRFPEELYIQLDGGAENANKYVLTLLELLVTRRMVRIVYFTRLPTGHTHEDIDACFAHIWSCFRGSPCLTLKEYRDRIITSFKDTKIPVKMKDIMVIPSYSKCLESCIDSKISNLHKGQQTQHCWRFEAVSISSHFKFGCKTTYKAYASDKVIEFECKPKSQCLSAIGQFTGLEPVTTYCPWQPNIDGVEGFYLLRNLPNWSIDRIPAHEFDPEALSKIKECLNEVKRRFSNSDLEREALEWWKQWEVEHAPETNAAADYVDKLKQTNRVFHTPLAEYLFGREASLSIAAPWSSKLMHEGKDINPGFQWPEILAAALPSVVTEFSPNPPGPRLYTADQSRLSVIKASFVSNTKAYYESLVLRRERDIVAIINQKVQPSGNLVTTGGRKETMVEKCRTNDYSFITIVFGTLSPHHASYVQQYFNHILSPEEMNFTVTSLGNDIHINRLLLLQFSGKQFIVSSGVNAAFQLFRNRNVSITSKESNRSFLPSFFLNCNTCQNIMSDQLDESRWEEHVPDIWDIDIAKVYRVYIPHEILEGRWGLIIIDFKLETIYYLHAYDHINDPIVSDIIESVRLRVNSLIRRRVGPQFRDWECVQYPYHNNNIDQEDTGVFIIIAVYFFVQECPLYIPSDTLNDIRKIIAYWLLEGKLPM